MFLVRCYRCCCCFRCEHRCATRSDGMQICLANGRHLVYLAATKSVLGFEIYVYLQLAPAVGQSSGSSGRSFPGPSPAKHHSAHVSLPTQVHYPQQYADQSAIAAIHRQASLPAGGRLGAYSRLLCGQLKCSARLPLGCISWRLFVRFSSALRDCKSSADVI